MTKLRATSIALFLAVAALALGACGDDGGSNESATTGTDATDTATGAADTTNGTTEAGTTTRERTGKTKTRERTGDDKGGSGGGSDDSSGSKGGGSSDPRPETQLTSKNIYSTSKTVCSQFLPITLERDLKEGKKSAEDIAKDYSAGYPSAERKKAYDGCIAGLKTKE